MSSTPIVNLSKGEMGPQLRGRIDAGQYAAGVKRARNVIVQRYGGMAARTGFRVIGKLSDQDAPARLVPFQYSIDQAYMLGMQQADAIAMAFGGFVLEEDLKITGATLTDPVVLTIPFHAYALGDRLYISGLTGATALNGRIATVTGVPSASTVTVDIDGTDVDALTDSTGTLRSEAPPPPPPPPPAPTPTPTPPEPPATGGGGGSGGGLCVTEDMLVLMADDRHKRAGDMRPGDMVRTMHETTMVSGVFRVSHVEKAWSDDIWNVDGLLATGEHRTRRSGKWVKHHDIGKMCDDGAVIVKITVEDAHTYFNVVDGNIVLSHNIKNYESQI